MSFFYEPRPYTDTEKQGAVRVIIENSIPDRDFYLLVIGAALFALCGIALDSIPVLIGAMIVAPLAAPIIASSLGAAIGNNRLATRSILTLLVACIGAGAIAAFVAYLLPPFHINGVFISFIAHPFYDFAIAVIAGGVAAYGHVRTKASPALTGVGVAISLMPPLVAGALALGRIDILLFQESLLILIANIAGILIGSFIVFKSFGISTRHR